MDAEALGRFIEENYHRPGDRPFRMEVLPAYEVASDGEDYRRWMEGAAGPPGPASSRGWTRCAASARTGRPPAGCGSCPSGSATTNGTRAVSVTATTSYRVRHLARRATHRPSGKRTDSLRRCHTRQLPPKVAGCGISAHCDTVPLERPISEAVDTP